MKRSAVYRAMLALVAAGVLAAASVALASGTSSTRSSVEPPAPPGTPRVSARVGTRPLGRPLPAGFVGLSLEYSAVEPYAGSPRTGVDPALVALIDNLTPGQRPVLRIGGNSADLTWRPQPGQHPPRHAKFALTGDWLRTTEALAARLDAQLIPDLNLKASRPGVAKAEAMAFERAIGPSYLDALEIGNEPDLYALFPWYREHGRSIYARPPSYRLSDYVGEFSRWRRTIGRQAAVAGPAFATFDWSLARFIAGEPGLKLVTFHHYPLDACLTNPSARGYPTIANLLSDQSSSGFAQQIGPAARIAHAAGLPFRLDELNSASCSGRWGVSNTFASALWMLDTLFNLARARVDGVNVHTFPGAAYAPFSVTHSRGGWRASAAPSYYGMLLFTQAFPPGARLLPVSISPAGPVKVWATQAPGSATRIVLINKDVGRTYVVRLRVAGLSGPLRLERLRAPSASSTGHTVLAGQTVGPGGRLRGTAHVETVPAVRGVYAVTLPAASAVLLSR